MGKQADSFHESLDSLSIEICDLRINTNQIAREQEEEATTLAMLTGNHVLLVGDPGTGKTQFAKNAILNNVSGARLFETSLTKFDSIEHVLGGIDLKKFKEESVIWYSVTNSIADVDIAIIDEFFDANDALIRTLLGVLNERLVEKGKQKIQSPLHSAIACSNYIRDNQFTQAAIDRFLIRIFVKPLKYQDDRITMYESFLGKSSTDEGDVQKVPIEIYKEARRLIRGDEIKFSDNMLVACDCLFSEFEKESEVFISDRRKNEALLLMRASALLNSREKVTAEDVPAIRYALEFVGKKDTNFEAIAKRVISDNIIASENDHVLRSMEKTLTLITQRVQAGEKDAIKEMEKVADIIQKGNELIAIGFPDQTRCSCLIKNARAVATEMQAMLLSIGTKLNIGDIGKNKDAT